MEPVRKDTTRDWFDRLDALPESERAAALAQIPDAAVRAEVASLFGALEGRGGFLETPIYAAPETPVPAAGEGRRVGPWRLLRLIGEGGMGAVWLGERADGRFVRQVAIKFLRGSVFSGFAAERFREEVSILGALEHPGIARLLDAGNAEDGSAYLVTEFVDGRDLEEWRRRAEPALRERLQVFSGLCAAVSYAHRALVVHRDLKPGNILITNAGEPKLLDFGLARLITPSGGATARDLSLLRAFTPAYASPEQIEGQPISTATDVFSLGIVLYELLTGVHPFRREGDEVATLSAVLQGEPALPSRAADDARLRGDLDTIILRALEKVPGRRYADARELGEDIDRHLESRPIRARRASLRYRAGKWIRRQPGLAAAGAGVVIALSAGALVSQLERDRAVQGEADAMRQRDLARDMAVVMVDELGANLARMTGPTEARVRLLEKAAEALALAAPDDAARARAELQLGKAYRSLGRLDPALVHVLAGRQAKTRDPLVAAALASLEGELRAARFQRKLARQCFEEARAALGGLRPETLQTAAEAQAWTNVRSNAALLTANSGKFEDARQQFGEVLVAVRAWLQRWPDDAELLRLGGKAASGATAALPVAEAAGAKAEALRWLRRAVQIAPGDPMVRHTFANVLGILALRTGNSPAEQAAAVAEMREARDVKRALLEADPGNVVFGFELLATAVDLSVSERRLGQEGPARATLDEAVAVVQRFAAAGITEQRLATASAATLAGLAFWHVEKGENEQAIPLLLETSKILHGSLRRDYENTVARGLLADNLSLLGEVQGSTKQYGAAEQTFWEALWWRRNEVRESGLPDHSVWLAQTLQGHGEMLAAANRRDEAMEAWREALSIIEGLKAAGKLAEDSDAWTTARGKLLAYLRNSQ